MNAAPLLSPDISAGPMPMSTANAHAVYRVGMAGKPRGFSRIPENLDDGRTNILPAPYYLVRPAAASPLSRTFTG